MLDNPAFEKPPLVETDLQCPRCGYNLRGLTVPRCPECGLAFDAEQVRAGVLRENIPTALDQADGWQPHQILWRSLRELARGMARPGRLLRTLDLHGPLSAAVWMLGGAFLWLWLSTSLLVAAAIAVHTGASPAAALKAGGLIWGPRILLASLAPLLWTSVLKWAPRIVQAARLPARQWIRLAAYWGPAMAAWSCLPFAVGLLIAPELVLPVAWVFPPLAILWALPVVGTTSSAQHKKNFVFWGILCVGALGAGLLAWAWLLPRTLDPPLWIYPL